MMSSRIRRYQDEQEKKKIYWAIGGSLGLIVFLAIFGLKILVGFSLLVDKIRGNSPANPGAGQTLLLSPVLDSLPTATNSAALALTGHGQEKMTVIIYVNDSQFRKLPIESDGTFSITNLPFKEGENTISAKLTDGKNTSDLSNVLTIEFKKKGPKMELDKPEQDAKISGDDNTVEVAGITEEDVSVTVNGRFVVTRSDGSFTYRFPLNDGENKLTIVATDDAGNTTTADRTVTYHK